MLIGVFSGRIGMLVCMFAIDPEICMYIGVWNSKVCMHISMDNFSRWCLLFSAK